MLPRWLLSMWSDSAGPDGMRAGPTRKEVPILWRLADRYNVDRDLVACTLCEFFCTFFLLYGGTSVAAGYVSIHSTFDYMKSIGWGLWLVSTLYIGFNISGAHLNPAISFLLFTLGEISLGRFFCYAVAQFIGSFLGAALTFLVYYEGISAFDGGVRKVYGPTATAEIFATYPKPYLSITGGIIDQFVTTAILCIIVLSITDKRNKIPKQMQPLLLGLALWSIVGFWSENCGAALNPARDFGPRLFTFFAGYGKEVFSYRGYKWFVVPLTAPMVGALTGEWTSGIFKLADTTQTETRSGGFVYRRFIGDYMPSEESVESLESTLPFNIYDSKAISSPIIKRPLADIQTLDRMVQSKLETNGDIR